MPEDEFLLLRHPLAPGPLSSAPNVREQVLSAEANGPGTLAWLPLLVNLRRVDLFHATFNILPARLRMPTVVTVHDVMSLSAPGLCHATNAWGFVQRSFYANGIRRALERATAIVTVSEATRRALIELEPDAAQRTTVGTLGIPDGFSAAASAEQSAEDQAIAAQLVPGARRFVLCVGQASPYKNHSRVLEAFGRAFADSPSTHLVFVHRLGSDRELLTCIDAPTRRRVHLLPAISRRSLVALYRCALVFCHASLIEGWGVPIGEALACGCPVVTSSSSAMPEVAGNAALYVDPTQVESIARALRVMADDERRRARCVAMGLERASELTWETHVSATIAAYRRALTATGGAASERCAEVALRANARS